MAKKTKQEAQQERLSLAEKRNRQERRNKKSRKEREQEKRRKKQERDRRKQKNIPTTAQQSIPYIRMLQDGICQVTKTFFSKTIQFYDINYQLALNEDKTTIFENYCDFLNYFDSSISVQLSFINQQVDVAEFEKSIDIPDQNDDFNAIREEYRTMLKNQLSNLNYSEEDNPLSLKADFILSLCELIVGGKNGLEPVEKTIIDRCVRLVYQECRIMCFRICRVFAIWRKKV